MRSGESDMARGRGCVTGDYTPSQVAAKSCPVRKYLTIPNIGARKRAGSYFRLSGHNDQTKVTRA